MIIDLNTRIHGLGWEIDITLNNIPVEHVMRADDERGYVDIATNTIVGGQLAGDFMFNTPQALVHRLFGDVKITLRNRIAPRKRYFLFPDIS